MMAEVYELKAWRHQLQQGDRGPKRNLTNLMIHLRGIRGLGDELRWNELTMQAEWRGRPLTEEDVIDIRLTLEAEGFQPTDRDVRPAIMRCAHDNAYHPVAAYFATLPAWDKKARLDHWLTRIFGAADNDYVRAISPKVLISAVARVYQPGCQVDTMLVLEGEQGLRKSSAIKALFGDDHTYEIVSGFNDHRRLANSWIGAWVVELVEFVSVTESNTGVVKGLVTMRHDRVQLPYARGLSDLPRRFVFVATINPGSSGYLDDDTGNRRYWPVVVSKTDLVTLAASRDQMWAEALYRYRAGERWWLEDEEKHLAEQQTKGREQGDVWADILADKLAHTSRVTPLDAMRTVGLLNDRMDRKAEMRVAKALKGLGFVIKHPKNAAGKTYREWVRP